MAKLAEGGYRNGRVDLAEPLDRRHFAKYLVGRDEVIGQFPFPKLPRHRQLQGIQPAKPQVECVSPYEPLWPLSSE